MPAAIEYTDSTGQPVASAPVAVPPPAVAVPVATPPTEIYMSTPRGAESRPVPVVLPPGVVERPSSPPPAPGAAGDMGFVQVTTPDGRKIIVSPQVARSFAAPAPAPQVIPYQTQLAPKDEAAFHLWIAKNKIPFDPSPRADYDMRGFYQALTAGDKRATVQQKPDALHFPDVWKTPYHATLSNESIYAPPNAPRWVGDKLVDWRGNIVADESPVKLDAAGAKIRNPPGYDPRYVPAIPIPGGSELK